MTVALAVPPLTVKKRHVRLIGHVRLIERLRYLSLDSTSAKTLHVPLQMNCGQSLRDTDDTAAEQRIEVAGCDA